MMYKFEDQKFLTPIRYGLIRRSSAWELFVVRLFREGVGIHTSPEELLAQEICTGTIVKGKETNFIYVLTTNTRPADLQIKKENHASLIHIPPKNLPYSV